MLFGGVAGCLATSLAWGAVFSLVLRHLNHLPLSDLVPLSLWWTALYLPLTIAGALAASVAGWQRPPSSSVAAFLRTAAGSALALVLVQLTVRWTPAFKAVSPYGASMVPMGALDLVLVAAIGVSALAALVAATAGGRDGGRWAAVSLGVLAAGYAVNHVYETPHVPDVATLVTPHAIAPDECAPSAGPAKKLVFLGLDGMTWRVAGPLMASGRLPNFAALVGRGAYGALEIPPPSYSPVVWASIATGLPGDAHHIHGFMRQQIPGVSAPIDAAPKATAFRWWAGSDWLLSLAARAGIVKTTPMPGTLRAGDALWDIANANGRTVGVFDWMNTWPASRLHGYMFTSVGDPPQNMYPVDRLAPVLERASGRMKKDLPRELVHYEQRFAQALEALETFRPDVSFSYNKGIDDMHDKWVGDSWLVTPLDPLRDPIPDIVVQSYEMADRWLGAFVAEAPPDAVVAVVSDHGYEFNDTSHQFSPPGVFVFAGGPFRCGEVVEGANVLDIAPTLLAALGLPGSEAMPGTVLRDAFAAPDTVPLTRLARFPATWRSRPAESAPTEKNWDQLREQLEALGYAN